MHPICFANKGPSSQSFGFTNSHVRMWELNYKENWALKNWRFWTMVLEKTLESPLDCKEIQPAHPKGDHSRVLIVRTDVETEMPILWPPDAKNWLTGKDPDSGNDWKQEEKGTTEDEMVGWHHQLMDMSLSKLRDWWWAGKPGVLQRVTKSQTQLRDWTELNICSWSFSLFWRLSKIHIATPAFYWLMLAWYILPIILLLIYLWLLSC